MKENSNWGETILIFIGDHETEYLITGLDSGPNLNPIVNDNEPEICMKWQSGNHTYSIIPFFANECR